MRKILVSFFALMIMGNVFAELPSWGLTKQQFESSIAISKLEKIGKTAVQKNYKLSITAPMDWHTKIRNILTVHGKLKVQMTFKDSLHESVSLVAEKGAKQIRSTASNNSNGHVSKQVLIDKPDIDTDVEAPNFDKKKYEMSENILLADLGKLALPDIKKPIRKKVSKPVRPKRINVQTSHTKPKKTVNKPNKPVVQLNSDNKAQNKSLMDDKDFLRARYSKNTRIKLTLSEKHLKKGDEIYIKGGATLVKRMIYRGRYSYYWYSGVLDGSNTNFKKYSDERYKFLGLVNKQSKPPVKTVANSASVKHKPSNNTNQNLAHNPEKTIATTATTNITTISETPDELANKENSETTLDKLVMKLSYNINDRKRLSNQYIKFTTVKNKISVSALKSNDFLYVLNNTVLVLRSENKKSSSAYWLEGKNINISSKIKKLAKNRYKITE